jgi:hypothetical protein
MFHLTDPGASVGRFHPAMKTTILILLIALSGIFLLFGWKDYIAPRDALTSTINQCRFEADKIFALDVAKWVDQNKTDAFNPFRRQRDEFVETCVKKEGWCSTGYDDVWPSNGSLDFEPHNQLARWLYEQRYLLGAHSECRD